MLTDKVEDILGWSIHDSVVKLVVGGLVFFILFYKLGAWGVLDTSEARYAEISRVMYETGDYLHPVYLGIEHYHKPPFTYWVTASAYHLFGVSAFSARFFLQIAFLLQLVLLFQMALLFWEDRKKAWIAVACYGSIFIVLISIRNLTTDAYLTTWIMGAICAIMAYAKKGGTILLYIAGCCAGFAFLTKITAAIFYIGAVTLLVIWYYKDSWKWSLHLLGAVLLFFSIALSWFYLLEIEGRQVLKYVLYDQSVVRYSSDTFNRSMPFYFYFLVAPLLCLPWLPMLASYYIARATQINFRRLLIWISVSILFPILFFSLSSSKLILYILPLFWSVALMMPMVMENISLTNIRRWYRFQIVCYTGLLLALILFPFFTDDQQGSVGMYFWLCIGSLLLILTVFNRKLSVVQKLRVNAFVFAGSVLLMAPHFLKTNEIHASTAKPVADWLTVRDFTDRKILVYDKLAPSLSFHLSDVVGMVGKNVKRELQWEKNDAWRDYYYPLNEDGTMTEQLYQTLADQDVILVVRSRRVKNVPENLLSHFQLREDVGIWTVLFN